MYEGIGELDQTFSYLSEGNKLRKKLLNYSIKQDENVFSYLKKSTTKLMENSLGMKECMIEPTPIFILGMPRSGTTLVKQIVSSHSKVTAAGELR